MIQQLQFSGSGFESYRCQTIRIIRTFTSN